VDEAIARFMPETAQERQRKAADGRHFDIDHDQVSFNGTSRVHGELDLADALDLEAAISAGAEELKQLGSDDSLDVRRSSAAGELARSQLSLDLTGEAETTSRRPRAKRQVVLHVHLSEAAVRSRNACAPGRVENAGGHLVTAGQIADWCGADESTIVVRPVIDLAEHIHVVSYEVPDRLSEQVALRDQTCVFPWCTRPARRCPRDAGHSCDDDHVVPHSRGGRHARATSRRCVDDIIGSRRMAVGATRFSSLASTYGRARTVTRICATRAAPRTSPTCPSRRRAGTTPPRRPTTSCSAPDPAGSGVGGARGMPGC
jgi:5-methylcytosine-specific restriction endonuclease McrA